MFQMNRFRPLKAALLVAMALTAAHVQAQDSKAGELAMAQIFGTELKLMGRCGVPQSRMAGSLKFRDTYAEAARLGDEYRAAARPELIRVMGVAAAKEELDKLQLPTAAEFESAIDAGERQGEAGHDVTAKKCAQLVQQWPQFDKAMGDKAASTQTMVDYLKKSLGEFKTRMAAAPASSASASGNR